MSCLKVTRLPGSAVPVRLRTLKSMRYSVTLFALAVSGSVSSVFADSSPVSLEGISDQGTFKVQLQWTANDIGRENQFNIVFRDNSTGTIIEDVHYDWQVDMGSQIL